MSEAQFRAKSPREELELILSDKGDFRVLCDYLEPLIKTATQKEKFGFEEAVRQRLHHELIEDIPGAVEKFLLNKNSIGNDASFSTYFTWYIAQRINAELKKKSVWGKIRAALRGS